MSRVFLIISYMILQDIFEFLLLKEIAYKQDELPFFRKERTVEYCMESFSHTLLLQTLQIQKLHPMPWMNVELLALLFKREPHF